MKTCVTFGLAALASSLLLSTSLHAADVRQPAKPGPGAPPAVPAAPPKPVVAPMPGVKPPGTPASSMPVANAPAATPYTPALALPDLMVEKPVRDGTGIYHSMEWTITNIGDADAHSSTASIGCEVIFSAYPETKCAVPANRTIDIPPLAKGASFKYKSPAVKIDTATGTQGEWKPYRVKFSAEVDPGNQVKEKSKSNNAFIFMYEESSGPPPGSQAAAPTPAKRAEAVKLSPRLTLKTEDPFIPSQPNWVVVKNDSQVDAPAAQVKFTCRYTEDHTKCTHTIDAVILIQPLAKGQGASVNRLDPPPSYRPHRLTYTLEGVEGAELVLNRP